MTVTTSKFTREDKKKLDHKRAINPALSAGAAGASGAALVANVGGMALRNAGQKKQFNDKLNDYEWVKREGASAKRMKAAKIGSKLQAKAIPITLAAGGINAVAAANGIQMSNLWNKKDKIKTVGVSKSLSGLLAGAAAQKAKKSGTQFALRELQAKGVIPNLGALAPTQRDKFFQGLGAGTLITAIAATPMLSSAFNRPGMDEFLPGVKKSQLSKSVKKDADYRSIFGYRQPRTNKEDNKQGRALRMGGILTSAVGGSGIAHGVSTLGAKRKFGGGKAIAAGLATSTVGGVMYPFGDQKRIKAWQERTGKNPYPDSPSR